jgi:phospho-N-acetylmuramoyl-pentapeptide-transferase
VIPLATFGETSFLGWLGDSLSMFWLALFIGLLIAKPIFSALLKYKAQQSIYQYAPGTHQVKQGTPTMGGLIIVFAFVLAAVAQRIWQLSRYGEENPVEPLVPWSALIVFVGFALIGYFDDFVMPKVRQSKRGFAWKEKIILQLAVAFGALWMHFNGALAPVVIGVFIILFAANAYNFADGLDGLAGSIYVGLAIGLVVLNQGGGWTSAACLGLLGAMIPFLFLNAPPARLFMGDVGSLAIGALIGLVLAQMTSHSVGIDGTTGQFFFDFETLLPVLLVSGMLFVELVPVPIQIASVKLFKRKVFPFTPVHHAFEKAGWPETRVVWTFAIAQLLFTLAAITAASWVTFDFLELAR